MGGRAIVDYRHPKTMQLTVQNISGMFRRKLSVASLGHFRDLNVQSHGTETASR